MKNVNTNLGEIFNRTYEVAANAGGVKTLFPTDGLEPEGFCIDARKLHQALESRQDFSTWIKSRIKRLRLIEGFDYNTRSQTYETCRGGYSTRLEYYLSPVAAKTLINKEPARSSRIPSRKLYVIQNLTTKSLKIGIAFDVKQRLKSLQTAHEHELKVIYETEPLPNAPALETRVHKAFKLKHLRGEWFKVNPEEVIKEVEKLTPKGLAEPLARLQRLALDHLRHKL